MSPEGPRRVLIVDDVPDVSRVLAQACERLRDPPVRVACARGGVGAVEFLRSTRFDLVISDYRMPGVDGLFVLAEARRLQPGCLRWLVTGYDEVPATRVLLADAAPDAVLRKPVATADLISILEASLRGDPAALARLRDDAGARVKLVAD